MTTNQNKSQAKRCPKFANFGEYLFWSYANLQMHAEEMDAMELPFKWQYIPLDYLLPECFM
jgi:hypothetical protein